LANEKKRRIKLLKPELVESLELELGKLLWVIIM
jgi:DNA-binding TFAR19-related protein (PDSD5 family)